MKMSDMGEKQFLKSLLPRLEQRHNFINGFGHDAGVIDLGLHDLALAFKIDRAARPLAAFKGWSDFKTWGRIAVVANISDILAVGASPKGFMLAISVPSSWPVADTEAIILGAEDECIANDVTFLGGDTKEDRTPSVVGAAIGLVCQDRIVGRRGALDGDVLVLAGFLGGFAGAYLLAERFGIGSLEKTWHNLLAKPQSAITEARAIYSKCAVHSAVDLSDGLWEALTLILPSGLGADVFLDQLPIHDAARDAARRLNINVENFGFSVGDWSMLFSMSEENALELIASSPPELRLAVIAKVRAECGILFLDRQSGRRFVLARELKNEHFRQRMEGDDDYFVDLVTGSLLRPTS